LTPVDIKSNLESLQKRVAAACQRVGRSPAEVTLIAVTKTVDASVMEASYNLGISHFGENRVQEAIEKIELLSRLQPHPTWHMIGHLQSNKVGPALQLFDLVQSIDSRELAEAINRRARKKVPVLLQVNVAGESTKSGFRVSQIEAEFKATSRLPNIEVQGLMTIAPFTEDPEQVRPVFRKLRELRDRFQVKHLSMGMTDDFEVAIEEGATLIRIGRALFGERT
jgi:pyridoxal phosphate enzyme (YggS family)